MPEEREKKAPTSIDLGEVETDAAPEAVELGVDATQGTTFSGTITTDAGVVLVDPSLMPPEKENMNKKQFIFGLLFPIVLGIIVASASAIFEGIDEGEQYEIAAQEDGSFNFTLGDYGIDCESSDGWFDIEWQTDEGHGHYYNHANSGCGEDLVVGLEEDVGNWYSNGAISVDLPFAPLENTSVAIEWYDQNSNRERTKVLDPLGDGSNTNFTGTESVPSHCYDIHRGHYYHLNEDGEESKSLIFGGEASNGCILYTNYDHILARNVNSVDPISFSFPENYSKVDSIRIDIWQDGDGGELFALALSSFCCLAGFGVPIGAYMAGHKWFAYGAGVGMVAVPVIFFIGCIAMIAMYAGGI